MSHLYDLNLEELKKVRLALMQHAPMTKRQLMGNLGVPLLCVAMGILSELRRPAWDNFVIIGFGLLSGGYFIWRYVKDRTVERIIAEAQEVLRKHGA